ncbi:MAG: transcriptional regulator, LysR family [Caulobacter sp.]|nr:transcriptional regulator, LysR family [Caulobacter sp.]
MAEADWSHYRALEAVLSEGSLSAAARALGLTQPTVGRQIAELERRLGVVLFTRSPQGLHPTDVARDLRPHAQAMAAAAGALARAASGGAGEARGTVRITASEIVGAEVLPPILARLARAHPGIVIEQVLSNQAEDLLRGAADIAVRMVAPSQEALTARKIGVVRLGLYAHRSYLAHRPAPQSLEEMAGHAIVGFDHETPFLRELLRRLPVSREQFTYRADSDLAQLAAIRAGVGIGFIQHAIARRDPGLVELLAGQLPFELGIWVAMHEDLRASRRMRLTFDALAEGLAGYLAPPP